MLSLESATSSSLFSASNSCILLSSFSSPLVLVRLIDNRSKNSSIRFSSIFVTIIVGISKFPKHAHAQYKNIQVLGIIHT